MNKFTHLVFKALITRVFTLVCLVLFSTPVFAQVQLNALMLNDDFTSGGGGWTLNGTGGPSANTGNNQWIVNDEYNGAPTYPNTTPQTMTVAGNISFPGGNYLHVHDQAAAPAIASCEFDPASASDRFVYMTGGVCTKGWANIRYSFFYVAEGNANAYGQCYYSADGGPWLAVGAPQYSNQTLWNYVTITNPNFDNRSNLRFGFRWFNSASAMPATQSFGIDDVFIIGDFDPNINPVNITVSGLPPSVCQGSNLLFTINLSDTLCNGQYTIQLVNPGGATVSTWAFNMFYPTTSITLAITIPTITPTGVCYHLRVNRVSPVPLITGILSVCFDIISCPEYHQYPATGRNDRVQPPGGIPVCVGSVIDVPFLSYGTYMGGNQYVAQLSDNAGSFAAPSVIGSMFSNTTFSLPSYPTPPGSVSGIVPNVPDGCGYYIRVISTFPGAVGSIWGPFCIHHCDVETNGRVDLQFCINQVVGDTQTITYTINNPPNTTTYNPGNQFLFELRNNLTFAQVNLGGLGSVTSTTGGTMTIAVPPVPVLLSRTGIAPGTYYARIVATDCTPSWDSLATLIRVTIGAPDANPPQIFHTPSNIICYNTGAVVFFYVINAPPTSANSTYQWFLNGSMFPPNQPMNPLGVQFNGNPGYYRFTVQETNYGCLGPMSAIDTITMITPPTGYDYRTPECMFRRYNNLPWRLSFRIPRMAGP